MILGYLDAEAIEDLNIKPLFLAGMIKWLETVSPDRRTYGLVRIGKTLLDLHEWKFLFKKAISILFQG